MVQSPQGDEIILVKQADVVHAYRNSCPHIGIGLDYGDGSCLVDGDKLICAMHGALFEAASGLCIDGPCNGQSLQRIAIRIEDGKIFLDA